MTTVPIYSDSPEYRPLYAANLLAELATQFARTDELATGWDQCEGFIDPTNADQFVEKTKNAYMLILDGLSESLGPTIAIVGLNQLNIPRAPSRFDWFRTIAAPFMISHRSETANEPRKFANLEIYNSFAIPLPVTETQKTDKADQFQLLYQQLEDEISSLEPDIHASLRRSVRDGLNFLLTTSIQERGDDDELLRVRSARGLYRFLSRSQCTRMPVLSLTADGNVYARWRQSRNRSIGALFQSGASVDYALRNLPKKHGGTTSPAELWSLIKSLGYDDLIRPTDFSQAA